MFPANPNLFSELDAATTRASQSFCEIAAAFRANVSGLTTAVSLPYILAATTLVSRHRKKIFLAERSHEARTK